MQGRSKDALAVLVRPMGGTTRSIRAIFMLLNCNKCLFYVEPDSPNACSVTIIDVSGHEYGHRTITTVNSYWVHHKFKRAGTTTAFYTSETKARKPSSVAQCPLCPL